MAKKQRQKYIPLQSIAHTKLSGRCNGLQVTFKGNQKQLKDIKVI